MAIRAPKIAATMAIAHIFHTALDWTRTVAALYVKAAMTKMTGMIKGAAILAQREARCAAVRFRSIGTITARERYAHIPQRRQGR